MDSDISFIPLQMRNNVEGNDKNQKINWKEELELNTTIQGSDKKVKIFKNEPHSNNVFLTGATGFLGLHILYDLLQNPLIGNVYCLVRGNQDTNASKSRVAQLLLKYKLEINLNQQSRIIPVIGDIEKPLLGLTELQLSLLSEQVDLIIHNAAMVNVYVGYNGSKRANTSATEDILRLATIGKHIIPVSFISTVATCLTASANAVVTDSDKPAIEALDYLIGYAQTKIVSEHYLFEAVKRGVPSIIFRPSRIYANSTTGVDNENDFLRYIIRGILHMKCYPEVDPDVNGSFLLSPVDWMASSITSLSLDNSNFNIHQQPKIFHLTNERNTSLEDIGSLLRNRGIKRVSYQEWLDQLEQSSASNPLYSMKDVFKLGFPGTGNLVFKNPITVEHLNKISKSSCPDLLDVVSKNIIYLSSI